MKKNNKNNKKIIFVLIVVALLVIGSIYAYFVYFQKEIDVEEGFDEVSVNYAGPGDVIDFYNTTSGESTKNATAISYINDESNYLILSVDVICTDGPGGDYYSTEVGIHIESKLDDDFNPRELKMMAKNMEGDNIDENYYHFFSELLDSNNAESWPYENNNLGGGGDDWAYVGFDLKDEDFTIDSRGGWDIMHDNYPNPYTLEIKAVMQGLSEDVEAVVNVNIEEGEI